MTEELLNNGKKWRAAIIGTGRIASLLEKDPLRSKPHTHASWYHHHPAVELVAGADLEEERLEAFGKDWKIDAKHLYEDFREMLKAETPDIVSVCAYAPQRKEMVLAALEHGAKALWLEKAIGCSIAEADAIADAILAAGAKAIVDYPRRSASIYRGVKAIIDEERFGRLLSIQVSMNGQLIHTGTHAFDVLHYWCGAVSHVTGWVDDNSIEEGEVTDGAGHGHILYENGVHVSVAAGRRAYYIFQFDLQFEEARIQIGNDVLQVLRPGPSQLYSGFEELFEDKEATQALLDTQCGQPLLYDLVESMQEPDRQPAYSIGNAVEALRVSLALFQSSEWGHQAIGLEEVDPELRVDSV